MRGFFLALSLAILSPTIASAVEEQPAETPKVTISTTTQTSGSGTTASNTADATKPSLQVTQLTLLPLPAKTPHEKVEAARQFRRTASLGDSIRLVTTNLGSYLDYAAKQNKAVTLFLDGNDTGITPEVLDREGNILQFHLERNEGNKKVWSALLRSPFKHQTREVKASIGLAGGVAEPGARPFTLSIVNWKWYTYFWVLLLLALLLIFGWLVAKRDLLRDGPKPSPYSLGRCQMAWWFFLIIIGYVMIWLISGDQDTITPSLLALMGISAATALGAVLIENTNGSASLSQAAADRLALQAAQQNAQQNVTAAQTAVAAAPADAVVQKQFSDAQATLAVVNAKLLAVNNQINDIATVPQTRSFLRDILSDSNGTVGLHRFQIAVWTVVLGIIFLVSVVMDLSMPVFSATLLATMGISAGTYLGFKFPEE
jgi:hypothetical protein